MKAAIYARVSTADQRCELQLGELREYVARCGWEPASEYVDEGFSGAKASRPALDRLMNDARQRRFDTVLCWKLDRWGRSLIHSLQSIQELASIGVRFVAVTQNIDTDQSNPMSRFMLHIFGAFSEFERELIRERTLSGIRAAKARGKALGRPRRVFRRDEVIRLRDGEGMSWRAIAKLLGVPVSTVRDVYRCAEKAPRKEPISQAKTKPKAEAA